MKRRRYVVRLDYSDMNRWYATGSCTWSRDRKRAFVFEDRAKLTGFENGKWWAAAHARELERCSALVVADTPYQKAVRAGLRETGWGDGRVKLKVVRLVPKKRRARSATIPFVTKP